ncbi:MAG: glycosyltransferase family 2 protein [Deltaproteobacteria bacterium]|nr:glycosyltransferase family 2 protein [Deltaproteobacteria bacterium]
MHLTVLVPVYNERARLKEVFQHLFTSPCPIARQWIVINDHSTDGSTDILRELKSQYGFELIEQPENRGKGAAIIAGLKAATGTFVMVQDADFEYDPTDVPRLLEPLIAGSADAVYGSRFKQSGSQVHRTFHYFGNRFLTAMSNIFSGIYLTDMETCYKLFRRDLVQAMNLRSARFGIEIEFTAYLAKTSARIFELPAHYYPRTRLQGKKIGVKDGIAALFHLLRFNLFTSLSEAFSDLPHAYSPDRYRMPFTAAPCPQ